MASTPWKTKWNEEDKLALDKIAFLSRVFDGPLSATEIAQRLSNLCRGSNPSLERHRGRKDDADEFTESMVSNQLKGSGRYPMPSWQNDLGVLETLAEEWEKKAKEGGWKVRKRAKGAKILLARKRQEQGLENLQPMSNVEDSRKGIVWNGDEVKFLVKHARLMLVFGGDMSYTAFAAWMSTHVGEEKDKPLKKRRLFRAGDEFTEDMVQKTVKELYEANDKHSGLPLKVDHKTKVSRPRYQRTTEEELLIVVNKVVSEQQKANRMKGGKRKSSSIGEVEEQAIGGPSRRPALKGSPGQAEKLEPHPRVSTTPNSSDPSKSQPSGGLRAAQMSGVAKGMSMLNPYQPNANTTAQARHPAAKSQNNPVSQRRGSQQMTYR